jgi:hypothetical protein
MSSEGEYRSEAEAQLERALEVRSALQATRKNEIKDLYREFPGLWELLVLDLNDGGQGAGPEMARFLGTNTTLLNRFIKQKRPIPIRDARTVADRIVTYLRSIQQAVSKTTARGAQTPNELPSKQEDPKPFVVEAVAWKTLVLTGDLQEKISEAVRLLDDVILHASTTNLPPNERALTEIERAQLIAVLKTTLKMLEAPMVETGLIKKTTSMLKRAGAKAVEKQVENAFAFAAGYAAGQLTALAKYI